jgi:ABC-type histidine transport system ATPase subunit
VLLILKEEEGELVVVVICMGLATDISKTSIYLHREHIDTVRFT